jgi:hypothetical protein
MSLHINRFVDSIKAHESRGQKDFVMSLRDAKDLHSDITKLLMTLAAMRTVPVENSVTEVVLDGGSFQSQNCKHADPVPGAQV